MSDWFLVVKSCLRPCLYVSPVVQGVRPCLSVLCGPSFSLFTTLSPANDFDVFPTIFWVVLPSSNAWSSLSLSPCNTHFSSFLCSKIQWYFGWVWLLFDFMSIYCLTPCLWDLVFWKSIFFKLWELFVSISGHYRYICFLFCFVFLLELW